MVTEDGHESVFTGASADLRYAATQRLRSERERSFPDYMIDIFDRLRFGYDPTTGAVLSREEADRKLRAYGIEP